MAADGARRRRCRAAASEQERERRLRWRARHSRGASLVESTRGSARGRPRRRTAAQERARAQTHERSRVPARAACPTGAGTPRPSGRAGGRSGQTSSRQRAGSRPRRPLRAASERRALALAAGWARTMRGRPARHLPSHLVALRQPYGTRYQAPAAESGSARMKERLRAHRGSQCATLGPGRAAWSTAARTPTRSGRAAPPPRRSTIPPSSPR